MRQLLNNVALLMAGQIARLALQGAYFIVLARLLGVSEYGAFAAVLALASLVTPFSSLGTNILMIRAVSRDSTTASGQWRRAASFTSLGGIALAALLTALGTWIAPAGVLAWVLFLLVLADLVGLKLIETAGAVWQSLGNTRALAVLPALLNALRLLAAISLMLLSESPDLEQWTILYASATLPMALVVVIVTTVKLGSAPRHWAGLSSADFRRGMLFSVGLSAQTVYNDIDKAMLARLVGNASAGVYSAAFRIIDMAYTPIRSMAAAAYPLYFRHGEAGLRGAVGLTSRIAPLVLGYGALASVGVWFIAPIAPILLGPGFDAAVEVIRWLAPVLFLRAVTYLAADALTGGDRQGYRTLVQIVIAVLNVAANLWLMPIWGIGAAIATSLVCEVLLGAALWLYIPIALRKEKQSSAEKPETGDS